MKNTPPVYVLFQVLQVTLINICKVTLKVFCFRCHVPNETCAKTFHKPKILSPTLQFCEK